MESGFKNFRRVAVSLSVAAVFCAPPAWADDPSGRGEASLAQRIFETMAQVPGTKAGFRLAHAKGIVCEGTFVPSQRAASISKAAHFHGDPVPVTVRLSGGAVDPSLPDYSPDAGPQGLAIRFKLPGGGATDIVALSHNGFVSGSGEEFLALQKAVVATDSKQAHPWPIEIFLGEHPLALKFVQDSARVPASFANAAFFGNDAFVFVNDQGARQAGRYQILPVAGRIDLPDAEAKAKSPNFLGEELRQRLANGPVEFRVLVQLANPGDQTIDPSLVWPDDRRVVEMGTLRIATVVADSDAAERALVFFPTSLTDGIELSDDPLPALRTSVYALSFGRRQSAR
jgi:catalase